MEFESANIDKIKSVGKKIIVGGLIVAGSLGAKEALEQNNEAKEDDKIELSGTKAINTFDEQGVEHNVNMFESDVPAEIEKIYFYSGDGSKREIIIKDGKFQWPGMNGNVTGVDKEGGEHILTF